MGKLCTSSVSENTKCDALSHLWTYCYLILFVTKYASFLSSNTIYCYTVSCILIWCAGGLPTLKVQTMNEDAALTPPSSGNRQHRRARTLPPVHTHRRSVTKSHHSCVKVINIWSFSFGRTGFESSAAKLHTKAYRTCCWWASLLLV